MSSKIGIGLIGFGGIGRIHAYGYHSLPLIYDPMPAQIELVGIAVQSVNTAEKAAKLGIARKITSDYHQLIEDPEISLIDICVPNHLHIPIIRDVMAAGKHIYYEKPLSTTLEEAESIKDAVGSFQGAFQLAFQYRFAPAILRAKQLILDGFLGDLISFQVGYYHAGYLGNERPMSWRLRRSESGGGALYDLGSHAADLLYFLCGSRFRKVLANLRTFVTSRIEKDGSYSKVDVDDHALMMVELESGAQGIIEASRVATGSTDDLDIILRGTKGSLSWKLMDPNWLEIYDATSPDKPYGGNRGWQRIEAIQSYGKPAVIPPGKMSIGWVRLHEACQFHLIQSIAEGKVSQPGFEAGLHNQQFLAAALLSAESNTWVNI